MRNRDNTAVPRLPAFGPSGLTKREDGGDRGHARAVVGPQSNNLPRLMRPPR